MTRKGSILATVLMSGGIDSAACAHHLCSQGFSVDGLFIDHGQAAAERETKAVSAIADHLGITLRKAGLSGSRPSGPGELLGRNAFLICTALFLNGGQSHLLGLGLHAGTPYYDCSEAFVAAIAKLVAEQTDGRVSVVAPFLTWTKKDVYDYFISAGLPIEVTYSCEAGTEPTCGRCASCRDRKALGC
jgi:7-cyano-7-deazaguanine synthase